MDQHDNELSALIKAKATRYQAPAELRNRMTRLGETINLSLQRGPDFVAGIAEVGVFKNAD